MLVVRSYRDPLYGYRSLSEKRRSQKGQKSSVFKVSWLYPVSPRSPAQVSLLQAFSDHWYRSARLNEWTLPPGRCIGRIPLLAHYAQYPCSEYALNAGSLSPWTTHTTISSIRTHTAFKGMGQRTSGRLRIQIQWRKNASASHTVHQITRGTPIRLTSERRKDPTRNGCNHWSCRDGRR